MHAKQIGAFSNREFAAIGEADRFGRGLTAAARSIAGTCRGNCSAAISRLEGM